MVINQSRMPALLQQTPAPVSPRDSMTPDTFFEPEIRWGEIQNYYQKQYAANLSEMGLAIRALHAKGIFIFQPDLSWKPLSGMKTSLEERRQYLSIIGNYEKTWHKILRATYPFAMTVMKKIAQNNGHAFYDFNQVILSKGDVHDWFEGNVHFSPHGRPVIASEIADIILRS